MSKGEDTKERIVDSAARVFNVKGYAATSMADLLEAADIEKGGLYNHFASKEAVALAAFDHAITVLRQREGVGTTGLDRVRSLVDSFERNAEDPPFPGGCYVLNTATDSDHGNRELRHRARAVVASWRAQVLEGVGEARAADSLVVDVDGDELATVVVATLEGAVMQASILKDHAHVHRAVAFLRRHLDALEGR